MQTVSLPAISVRGAHVVEGTSNMTAVTLEVSLSTPSSSPARVSFSTLAASAVAGVDYQTASGMIEFAPGEQTKSITLQVFGDALLEEDEMFSVVLSDPVNAAIENGSAIVVIANDDQAPARRRPSRH